ncbi:hypothetical protein V8B97DRAFT_1844675, partial [Scleroderma yunnanense]
VLDDPYCPAFIKYIDSSMIPISTFSLPDNISQSTLVKFPDGAKRSLGLDLNSDLYVAEE